MTGSIDLNPNHLAIVLGILAEHVPECEVRAFGSRASWTSRDYSDLDLAIVGEGELHWRTLARLKEAFEESRLPMRVDVLDWHSISQSFREVIEGEFVVVQERPKQTTSSKWTEVKLGSACTKIGSGATPRGGKEAYVQDGPYALIRSQNVYNTGFTRDGLAFISDEQAEALQNAEVLPDDVLLNITGDSVARVCQVDPLVLPARVNQHVAIIRPDSDKLDAAYLRYNLAAPEVQAMLLSWAGSGGTRNALTKQMIESFQVQAPEDLAEQRAIAHVLGTLDDKIELNRRMNETLDQIARALFKSWFVDFDPVRAKMEGRWGRDESLPGLPAEHYDFFPDRLVPSELGEIPEGWEVKALDKMSDLNPESWSRLNSPARIEYVDLGNTKWGVIESTQHFLWKDAPSRARRVLRPGDTIVGTVRPGNGSYALIGKEGLTGSTGFTVFRPLNPQLRELVYLAATSPENIERLSCRADGAAYPSVRPEVVVETEVAIPTAESYVLHWFSMTAGSILDKMEANKVESRVLTAQNNRFLPKLISGAIRVGKGFSQSLELSLHQQTRLWTLT